MPELPNADDILRAVSYIQDGRILEDSAPLEAWYDTTGGVDDAAPVQSDYIGESYAAGWDTAAYAYGNADADAHDPQAYHSDEYASGLLAAISAVFGGSK